MKNEKSCGAITLRKNENQLQVLCIRHVLGHWGFPKGHVEEQESEYETAIRETFEETGIKVTCRDGFRYAIHYSPRENVMKEVVYFLADYCEGEIKTQVEEVQAAIWVSLRDALMLCTYDDEANVLRKAIQYLKDQGEIEDD